MEIPIKMDDLGGKPTIFGNTHLFSVCLLLKIVFQRVVLFQPSKIPPKNLSRL